MDQIKPFLNTDMQLTALPAKRRKKLHALYYLSQKLECGKQYTESEINGALGLWHTFHDPATLRREMYNHCLIGRSRDGKCYWVEEPRPQLESWIAQYL
ncbi:MAG: DUF2087 domain-containing protein [Clostridiales bacterium]|nr:DUF2087 domain-containing protein [Clostridiales bacterium]